MANGDVLPPNPISDSLLSLRLHNRSVSVVAEQDEEDKSDERLASVFLKKAKTGVVTFGSLRMGARSRSIVEDFP